VTLLDFPMLADENVHAEVVRFLRDLGCDVLAVRESDSIGASDRQLLRWAAAEGRIILTHDRDFGRLAVLAGEPVVGIVYLRPGHIDPAFTIESLQAIVRQDHELAPPFILVAARSGNRVQIRLRPL
jgi:predicted nuclease of predicted toxin-antitoxin system